MENFEDLAWLFNCDSRNRGIIRQGFDEAALLWKAVKATAGDILEIGRNHAGSTVVLATAADSDRVIYSIDLNPKHDPRCEEFLQRAENQKRVRLLVGDSRERLPSATYGLLFIDGDHSYDGVLADTRAHWNALKNVNGKPGLAVFHDALPNENFKWRDADRRFNRFWIRLKNKLRARQKPEVAPDYGVGVNRVCRKLLDERLAEQWGAASSMLVLRKLADLPDDFGKDATATGN
jgi:predicted O-methyltransferase YrrM